MPIKLVAMDLDGTITQHRSKPENENIQLLNALKNRYRLLIIGAGSCSRIFEQLNQFPIDIIGNYGMQLSEIHNNNIIITYNKTVHVDIPNVTDRVSQLRDEFGYTCFKGDTVEVHPSGMLTFPLIGTKASIENKLAFDPTKEKRRPMLDRVRQLFYEYTVFIGGSSSFDIVPKPYNKLYALESYVQQYGFDKTETVFIGDDYGPGGNDEHVYLSDYEFICVDDHRALSKACVKLLLGDG